MSDGTAQSADRSTGPPADLSAGSPADLRRIPARRWFFVFAALGVAVLLLSIALAPGAPRIDEAPPAPDVHVFTLVPETVHPQLVGYGEIRPRQTWQGVVQVPGRVTYRHPELRAGATFAAGTVLLEIDPDDYRLALAGSESRVASAEAALAELTARGTDLITSRDLERRALTIAEREFDRRERLAAGGHIAALELDAEQQRLLRQRQTLQNLEAQLNVLPAQQAARRAQLAEARAVLARSQQDLERTRLELPFAARIVDVAAEQSQFLPAGQVAIVAESLGDLEVAVEVPMDQLLRRFPSIFADAALRADPGVLLPARIDYRVRDFALSWSGRVLRIDPGLNPATRAALLYVGVDADPANPPPGSHLYARVEITGPPLEQRLVIPRLAVRAGVVYVVDADERLRRREVTVAFRDRDRVVIDHGLQPGERILLTALPYPVDGMPVSVADAPVAGARVAGTP